MKYLKIVLTFLIVIIVSCTQKEGGVKVINDFPGGNIKIDSTTDNTLFIRPDNRNTDTTKEHWFYWSFKVTNVEDKTLTFKFNHPYPLTNAGPAISRDKGESWSFLWGNNLHDTSSFSYYFENLDDTVWFSMSIPYTAKDFDTFCEKHKLNKEFLCKSNRGRAVEMLKLGSDTAKTALVFTARHHACEATASFVLEGIIKEWLQNNYLNNNTQLFVIPFMDKDGVELGEQGKRRIPHDHNRDYIKERYNEVKSFKSNFTAWTNNRPTIFIDIHSPWIKNGINETIFFIGKEDAIRTNNAKELMAFISNSNMFGLPFTEDDIIEHGTGWNKGTMEKAKESGLMSSTLWGATVENTVISSTLEVSYALVHGSIVSKEKLRLFGKAVGKGVEQFWEEY
jgi:hypothetical protein